MILLKSGPLFDSLIKERNNTITITVPPEDYPTKVLPHLFGSVTFERKYIQSVVGKTKIDMTVFYATETFPGDFLRLIDNGDVALIIDN